MIHWWETGFYIFLWVLLSPRAVTLLVAHLELVNVCFYILLKQANFRLFISQGKSHRANPVIQVLVYNYGVWIKHLRYLSSPLICHMILTPNVCLPYGGQQLTSLLSLLNFQAIAFHWSPWILPYDYTVTKDFRKVYIHNVVLPSSFFFF